MSGPAYANQVSVEKPTLDDEKELRADHPRLRDYARNGFELGWGNEHVCRVTGLPPELVDKYRHEFEKEKSAK